MHQILHDLVISFQMTSLCIEDNNFYFIWWVWTLNAAFLVDTESEHVAGWHHKFKNSKRIVGVIFIVILLLAPSIFSKLRVLLNLYDYQEFFLKLGSPHTWSVNRPLISLNFKWNLDKSESHKTINSGSSSNIFSRCSVISGLPKIKFFMIHFREVLQDRHYQIYILAAVHLYISVHCQWIS